MAMGRELASERPQELPFSVVIATRKCRRKVVATPHDSISDIDTSMRCHAELLGERILQGTQGTAIRKRTLRLSSGSNSVLRTVARRGSPPRISTPLIIPDSFRTRQRCEYRRPANERTVVRYVRHRWDFAYALTGSFDRREGPPHARPESPRASRFP
jgi:hypothetical protein